jgi:1-acyl-sn-glycerol-3-phosphate acyltransferase
MKFARSILLLFVKIYIRLKYSISVKNKGVLRQLQAPLIFISNHPSLLDSVIYKCVLGRPFFICGAKEKYFSSRRKRILMKLGRVIKVTSEEMFVKDCMDLIRDRKNILVYPEMGRYRNMEKFVNWCAKVAIHANATVIPLKIAGTEKESIRNIEVRIGEAINSQECCSSDELNELFYNKIKSL